MSRRVPDLQFEIEGVEPVTHAASPLLAFKLRSTNADPDERIHSIMLRCQIKIEATRRQYEAGDHTRLLDVFGEPARWGQTLRSMHWTIANVVVPAFAGSSVVELQVPCSYDFNLAATKYFYALEGGEVPLTILFSGTVFYATEQGALQVTQIPWDRESVYRLPVQVWKEMMELYYPNTAWISLRKDVFDRLYQVKVREGIPTWEQLIERLLAMEEVRP